MRMKFGYVRSLKTMKPVSAAYGCPNASNETVFVCPPA